MAVGIPARLARLESELRDLRARVGQVEHEQVRQIRRSERVNQTLRLVLARFREQRSEMARFQNRVESAIQRAISAADT